jgi:hypothetical protein
MAAIGKLLAVLTLAASLLVLAWSVMTFAERPGWFDPAPERVEKGNNPANFALMKNDIDALTRGAAAASQSWGAQLKALENREKVRADRRKGYDLRLQWARTGNPKDLIDPADPKSGKGFYEPVIDPATNLHDLTKLGNPILGTDGTPLRGTDNLLATIERDTAAITDKPDGLNAQIVAQRQLYAKLSADVIATEARMIKMGTIRDSVQAELFYLAGFEVNVFETRELVVRRERQLRARLKELGLVNP